jgi:ribonucleoside-diphosphate reductase alpha chain
VASDILAQKYFRKAGVPARLKKVEENSRSLVAVALGADTEALAELPEDERYSVAKCPRSRCSTAWPAPGPTGAGRAATFDAEEDALAFYRRDACTCWPPSGAPNSPQWFNTGLHWAYGIDGPGQGHHYVDFETGKLVKSKSAYEHPQPHACFIQSISDDLVNEGGIMDLWVREARLFKYGSGTGSNFSFCAARTSPCPAAASPRA